ncbi:UvrABC system protein A [Candidatus Sulfobium mesophilum]|uniref:UvrABC system protein A n=1 Tax=Candidatus Sulfobium mesophilum TaxID=2016548 RepID=A0A2U3QF92_9BACT|nr:UvrABC system protein A [Candidatus Sulfobium mesophilum]
MSRKELIIEGARQNNLKNITLRLPHNKVIAVTGVSGSGKSSLAFDTIFAEGQWRFIESLSTYARLFLEKLDRPDVDAIHNIRPAIALEQKNPVRGSRSTVGTLTELYELFRLLYSKIATPYCPNCGKEIRRWDPSQIVSELQEKHTGRKAVIIFSLKGTAGELQKRGFQRVWRDGGIRGIEEVRKDETDGGTHPPHHLFEVVLDRLVIKEEPRFADSVEMAWKEGNGRIKVVIFDPDDVSRFTVHSFSSENVCEECGIELPLPTAILFSFNHPVGACPMCKGFGNTLLYDEDLIVPDKTLSLAQGAVDPWNKPAYRWWKKQLLDKGRKAGLDVQKPYEDLSAEEKKLLFKGGHGFYGIDDFFEDMEGRRYKLHVRVFLSRYRRGFTCPDCNGKRLKKEVLAYKVSGLDIAELCRMSISDAAKLFADIDLSPFKKNISAELLRQIGMKLQFLEKVGLDYLTLDRYGKTLSGGEYQRVNLSNQLASLLTGTLYVLDEPTVGLHARDTARIAAIMHQLSTLGNTVVVVEHDRGIISEAEWIVELGPGGGQKGGEVVFSGPLRNFLKADTLTSRYMRGIEKVDIPARPKRVAVTNLALFGARGNNLKGIDFRAPLNSLTVVTGVSGSGKSSLVVGTLYRALSKKFKAGNEPPLPYDKMEGDIYLKGVKLIDQSPIGRSPRSNPVTYLKIFDHIRKLFSEQREARAYGYGPGFFSFNVSGGRCETCKGEGYELMEMYFFEDLYIRCEKCDGKRYGPEALRIKYREKNISDVLNMTVAEAHIFFADQPKIKTQLQLLVDTGLGYLRLGQPATTLSGGEAQRLKICSELTGVGELGLGGSKTRPKTPVPNPGYLYILDEPTVGLHFADVQALLNILGRLVESGNTVLVIEHNLDLVKTADWIVDLGPEGGDKGGKIVFEGTPSQILKSKKSYTGEYLRQYK